jgi:hypothetical protein
MRAKNRMTPSTRSIAAMLILGVCAGWGGPSLAAPGAESPPDAASPAAAESIAGTIVETMDAAGYTYVLVDTGTRKVWAAGPRTAVAVGEKVELPSGMAMRDFHSKTLDRSFDLIFFVSSFGGVGRAPAAAAGSSASAAAAGHGSPHRETAAVPPLDLSDIEKASGGHTVAELFAGKEALEGVETAVRGRVVKFNAGIMGRNWIHIRDGSGSEGRDDLTVTTGDSARVGDLVVVRGTLRTNQDFGHGYSYDVLIEKATVEVE